MASNKIYQELLNLKRQNLTGFAVLVDPDKISPIQMEQLAEQCQNAGVNYLLVGGSLVVSQQLEACILSFKSKSKIPVILFPGHPSQVTPVADALLFLSLISGRNPEHLIGQHVVAAPMIKETGLEVISTGYMVIDGGAPTSVSYMSHSAPIPANKPDLALCTAWASELLGQHILYMDAGSGAPHPISKVMIEKVAKNTQMPLFVGGGIRTKEGVRIAAEAGATVVVVGNALENNFNKIEELISGIKEQSS